MKRVVFTLMALMVGILLPLQSAESRRFPWEMNPYDIDPGEDHPWGGDINDPGGVRIQPGGEYGYIQMSIIGRVINYSLPIVMRLYSHRVASPTSSEIVNPDSPTSSRIIKMSGGK